MVTFVPAFRSSALLRLMSVVAVESVIVPVELNLWLDIYGSTGDSSVLQEKLSVMNNDKGSTNLSSIYLFK